MKKIIFLAALFGAFLIPEKASAQQKVQTQEVGYSTFAVKGVLCSTGSVTNLTETLPTGFHGRVAGYRIQNQNGSNDIYLGGVSVSTDTAVNADLSNLGERLDPGGSSVFQIGYDIGIAGLPRKHVYCKAEDAAGANGIVTSVNFFGY